MSNTTKPLHKNLLVPRTLDKLGMLKKLPNNQQSVLSRNSNGSGESSLDIQGISVVSNRNINFCNSSNESQVKLEDKFKWVGKLKKTVEAEHRENQERARIR